MLNKTVLDDFNDLILLFRSHLVVGRQAKSSAENIHADIQSLSLVDVGVALASAVSVSRNESVIPIDRLGMHRFPDRSSFGVMCRQRFQDLGRT